MKEKIIENGIEYVRNGDYYIPNLTVPDEKVYNIGKYGRMHEQNQTAYSLMLGSMVRQMDIATASLWT